MKLSIGIGALLLWSACATPTQSLSSARISASPDPMNMNNKQAVLVLDMQNDFCHSEGKMHGMVKDELARTDVVASSLRLVRAAQAKGVLSIVSPIHFDYSQPASSAPEGIAAPIFEMRAFDGTSFGGELLEAFERLTHEDHVIKMSKPSLSAFTGTDLDRILKERGIEEIFVAGLLTNYCVENTVRDAFDLGYRVRVVEDATATFDTEQRDYAMNTIFPMLGKVVTVDEFSSAPAASRQ